MMTLLLVGLTSVTRVCRVAMLLSGVAVTVRKYSIEAQLVPRVRLHVPNVSIA